LIKKLFIIALLLALYAPTLLGQASIYHAECQENIQKLRQWYQEGAYLLVLSLYNEQKAFRQECDEEDKREAQLLQLLSECFINIFNDNNLTLSAFAIANNNSIQGTEATEYLLQELVNEKDWHRAKYWFEKPNYFPTRNMDVDAWQLAYGYSLFRLELYNEAITSLSKVSGKHSRYYQSAQYYSALSHDKMGDWQSAIQTFLAMKDVGPYQNDIPYFIGQLLYKNNRHEQLTAHVSDHMQNKEVNPKLFRLAGLDAYARKDYNLAAQFMNQYVKFSVSVFEDDYFILAFSQYMNSSVDEAEYNFLKISHLDSRLGQLSNYYIGDIKLIKGDKISARNAYHSVSRYDHDTILSDHAYFIYGKLSAELRHDHEAIMVLRDLQPSSPYYSEAQTILRDILLTTPNFTLALQTLGELEFKSAVLKQAEHIILYKQSMEMINNGRLEEAKSQLKIVSKREDDIESRTLALYWSAEIHFRSSEFDIARSKYQEFLIEANATQFDPLLARTYYALGYILLKEQDYRLAIDHFSAALGHNENDETIETDARLRLADCYLKLNDYNSALEIYNLVLEGQSGRSVDYTLYQKATIQGLMDQPYKKLLTLETLIDLYDDSRYLDDAIFETGVTLHRLSKPREAIKSFRYLVDQFTNESSLVTPSLIKLGLISYNLGDLKQSADYYKHALQMPLSKNLKGECFAALKEIYVNDLARPDAYIKIVEEHSNKKTKDTTRDSLSYQAAVHQFELSNYERASDAFELYLEQHAEGAFTYEAHVALADCYIETKMYNSALTHLVYLCGHGGDGVARACFNGAEIAYHHQQDYTKAIELYTSASENFSALPRHLKTGISLRWPSTTIILLRNIPAAKWRPKADTTWLRYTTIKSNTA
jgi:tetratricopeptide (TPR) repeat protein